MVKGVLFYISDNDKTLSSSQNKTIEVKTSNARGYKIVADGEDFLVKSVLL